MQLHVLVAGQASQAYVRQATGKTTGQLTGTSNGESLDFEVPLE